MESSRDEGGLADLRDRLGRGEDHAFDDLVRRFWPATFAFLRARVGRTEAEDLAQDVFAATVHAVRSGHGPVSSDAAGWRRYLLTSARHRLLRHRRGGLVVESLRDPDDLSEGTGGAGVADVQTPHRTLDGEAYEALQSCVARLDDDRRRIVWKHFVEGMSKREVARETGRAESSVRAILVSALRDLRRCLERKGWSIDDM